MTTTKKTNVDAQVTGFMTVENSKKLPMTVKQRVVSAEPGQVRKIRKILIDPETGEQVVLTGKLYIGGMKDGKVVADRNQSLVARIAFKVNNIESFLAETKPAEVAADELLENELLAALL